MSNKNFKKEELIQNLSEKTGYSFQLSKKLINDLIEAILDTIKSSGLNLKNIGTIKTILKKERLGRNPKTKEEFIIKSRKSISFFASKKLLDKLNKKL